VTLANLSDFATRLKPILECLAYLAGALALVKWLRERTDRATDVLLKLEEEFDRKCAAGRQCLDEPPKYAECREALTRAGRGSVSLTADQQAQQLQIIKAIDDLLRFYVVLIGVREAKQLPDASLSTCYRFWLAHYYRDDRLEFRRYVNDNYPTLRAWLLRDTSALARFRARPFSRWWQPFFRCDFWRTEDVNRNRAALYDAS
jgi:hypothetical protein